MTRMRARWTIDVIEDDRMIIRDIGHDTGCPTITNDAAAVVAYVVGKKFLDRPVGQRRLFYRDSEGELAELVVEQGRFAGFAVAEPAAAKGGAT